MGSLNKKKFEEQGYAIVKNVLNFDNDLKPILNDMEYVMDRLIPVSYTHLTLPTILLV